MGTISATTGNAIRNNGTIGTLINTGTISATTGVALNIATGGVLTTMTNTGGIITSANVTGPGGATMIIGSTSQTALTLNGTIRNTASNNTAEALAITAAPAGTITNAGTIQSNGTGSALGVAIELAAASTLANSSTGTITGQIIDTGNVATTLTNAGGITGVITIDGNAAHTFTNTGTVTGAVTIGGNATNTISITGGSLSSTLTGGSGQDDLTLTGSTIAGAVDLGGSNANTVTVDNGTFTTSNTFTASGRLNTHVTSDGTMSIGHNYTGNAGTLQVDASGIFGVTAGTFGSTGAFTSSGTSTFSGGASTVGAITNGAAGIINLTGGSLASGNIDNTGTINVRTSNLTSSGALHNTGGTINIDEGHTLTVNSFTAGTGVFNFQVKADSVTPTTLTNGQLVVGGAVDMTGATIKANVNSGSGTIANNSRFKIVDGSTGAATTPAASTVTPVSLGVANGDTALYKFYYTTGDYAGMLYGGAIGGSNQDIYLIATRATIDSSLGPAITPTDSALAGVLNDIGTGGGDALDALQDALAAASTDEEIHQILEAASPPPSSAAQTAAVDVGATSQGLNDTRVAALESGDEMTSGISAGDSTNGLGFWAQVYGQSANQDERDANPGYDSRTWGGAAGIDTENLIDRGILGVALNYGNTDVESDNANASETDVDSYGISLYGSYDLGQRVYLNGQAGYTYNDIETDRYNTNGANTTAHGDFNSNMYSAKLGLSRNYQLNTLTLTPGVSASYAHLDTDGYTETGPTLAIKRIIEDESQDILNLGLGATATWSVRQADGSELKPSLRAGYAYQAVGDAVQETAAFAEVPGTTFTTEGADPARNQFSVGGGVTYLRTDNWSFSANYDYQYKQDYSSHNGVLRAALKF